MALHGRSNKEKFTSFVNCDAIDVLAREFDGGTFEASVHDESMEVSVTFECPDIVIRTQKHRFDDLVERSNAVRFSHGEGDTAAVEFVFPSIRNRAV